MQKLTQRIPDIGDLVRQQEIAIDSATHMLNALLDISRLESGTVEPQLLPVSLATTFQIASPRLRERTRLSTHLWTQRHVIR